MPHDAPGGSIVIECRGCGRAIGEVSGADRGQIVCGPAGAGDYLPYCGPACARDGISGGFSAGDRIRRRRAER